MLESVNVFFQSFDEHGTVPVIRKKLEMSWKSKLCSLIGIVILIDYSLLMRVGDRNDEYCIFDKCCVYFESCCHPKCINCEMSCHLGISVGYVASNS